MRTYGVVAVAVLFVLSACSTYKARDEGFGKMGCQEEKLKDGSYKLAYYGSAFDDEADVRGKWHKRAAELCGGKDFVASTKVGEWTYDGYTILPPLIFVSKDASPLLEGELVCNS